MLKEIQKTVEKLFRTLSRIMVANEDGIAFGEGKKSSKGMVKVEWWRRHDQWVTRYHPRTFARKVEKRSEVVHDAVGEWYHVTAIADVE